MAKIVVNEYLDGSNAIIPHMNVSLYDDNNNHLGTFGANISPSDSNPLDGWSGGVYNEAARLGDATTQIEFFFSESAVLDAYAYAIDRLNMTGMGVDDYNLFSGNCVDFANNVLTEAGMGNWHINYYLTDNTLLERYAWANEWFFNNPDEWWLYEAWTQTGWAAEQAFDWYHDLADQIGGHADAIIDSMRTYFDMYGSPIAIDLNGDGVQTTYMGEENIWFDVTGDGATERTGWLSGDDAFLAFDANANGKVDGVNELFGGQERGVGFSELALFDSNGDFLINAADERFDELQLWQDANQNGITDEGELASLLDFGVSEINLNFEDVDISNHGNRFFETSTATVNGVLSQVADIYFRYSLQQEEPFSA